MKTVKLFEPITYGNDADGKPKTLNEFTLRKPTAGDLRGVKLLSVHEMDPSVLFVLIPRLASPALTAAHLQELSAPDTANLFGVLGDFFQPTASPTTR